MDAPGSVTLVGAGPGDPGLLTIRGRDALAAADVVLYDHLVQDRLLELAPPRAERVFVGKRAGHAVLSQAEINDRLIAEARRGRRVVRLKGGDPYVFGRGAEEAEALHAAGVPFAVVPGVTAGVGVTAYAGLPVTHRAAASAVAFVTGHDDPSIDGSKLDWPALARFPGTLVVYMGARRLRAIAEALIAAGKDPATPAAVVERGTTSRQRLVAGTLADLPDRAAEAGIGPPALTVIGPIVGRRAPLAWFERLPLFGKTVLVTRPRREQAEAAASLEALGAEVIPAPTVEIGPAADPAPMDSAIDRLADFDWLVFTSGNGVRYFLGRLLERGKDLRSLGGLKLAAIGPGTAATLRENGLRADLVPPEYRSESLARELAGQVAGRAVLLARADRGRDVLRRELLGVTSRVEQVAVYANADAERLPEGVLAQIAAGQVHWVTFTSSAIAERFHALLPPGLRQDIGRRPRIATISPVTSDAVKRLGWPIAAEAREFTWDGVVRAILEADLSLVPCPSSLGTNFGGTLRRRGTRDKGQGTRDK